MKREPPAALLGVQRFPMSARSEPPLLRPRSLGRWWFGREAPILRKRAGPPPNLSARGRLEETRTLKGSGKTRHQKMASETRAWNSTSVTETKPYPRNAAVRRGFEGPWHFGRWRPGLAAWGGRIRNCAFRMIVIEPDGSR